MNNLALRMLIRKYEIEYLHFMGIECLPTYSIVFKEISLNTADAQGYDSPAATQYNRETGEHTLEIWPEGLKLEGAPLVFHEFTHMLDAEKYSYKNDAKYVANKGFTEYHASQIDLLKRLGAKKVNEPISFSINTTIEHLGKRITVGEFLDGSCSTACEIINRKDFPKDVETLSTALGIIFNYLGRRSICKMYSTDYKDVIDDSRLSSLIGNAHFSLLKGLMSGWLDDKAVAAVDDLFFRIASDLLQQYQLI